MSSITEPQTFADLTTAFLKDVGEGRNTDSLELAKRYINTALVNMHHPDERYEFLWAERTGALVTHAPYQTGTVTINTTVSRTAVAGSSTLWNTATGFGFNNVRASGKIKFGGAYDHYEVASVTSDTALTLLHTYVGDDLSGQSYVYFEDEYALASDFLYPVDFKNFSTAMQIPLIGRTDFDRMCVRNDFFNKPKIAKLIQLGFSGDTSARYRVVFHPAPDDEYHIPYRYTTSKLAVSAAGVEQERLVEDTDEPIVPRGKRDAIRLWAMYEYYVHHKDDLARAQACKADFVDYMMRIAGANRSTNSKPQFYVARGRSGRVSQRFDYGNRMDTLRDRWRY